MWDVAPALSRLEESISDPSSPIGMRMRAAYFLKQAYMDVKDNDNDNNQDNKEDIQQRVINCLTTGLKDTRHGSLMRHEYAYVMGQLRDERCCPALQEIVVSDTDCSMVRHEAAEALAAIGAASSRPILQQVLESTRDTVPELYETCLLALNVMDWRLDSDNNPNQEEPVGCACMMNPYRSVDPAPPHAAHAALTYTQLGDLLCDPSQSLFDRYRAMFSLRNRGGDKAVHELCRALNLDNTTTSALLRHEVAYVLGQLQHPDSVTALEQSLRNTHEHAMVRHESAEALGAIERAWDRVEVILQEFTRDDNPVVRESCLVALDAADYWGHNNMNNNNQDDDGEEEETTTNERVSSFAKEKANGIPMESTTTNHNQDILQHHFNIQVT